MRTVEVVPTGAPSSSGSCAPTVANPNPVVRACGGALARANAIAGPWLTRAIGQLAAPTPLATTEAGRLLPGMPVATVHGHVSALNAQVGSELHASHQYISIAAHFDAENLPRLAEFFYRQADEEKMHAMKFVRHVVDLGGRVQVPAIASPRSHFATAEEAVALSLQWEHTVTGQIYDLVDIAKADRDYISMRFLDWFVSEQLEEINTMETLLSLVQRAGEDNLLLVEDYIGENQIGDGGGEQKKGHD